MKQSAFDFSGRPPKQGKCQDPAWAEIVAADPVRYPGLMQRLAAMTLHRIGRPHQMAACRLCQRAKREDAA